MDSADDSYDIRALNVTASTSQEQLLLIDDRGCSVSTALFPSFQHEVSGNSRKLIAKFKAFKFATSSNVNFKVVIQFCQKTCAAVNCGDDVSYGKRRKREDTVRNIVNESPETDTLSPIKFPDENATNAMPKLNPIIFPSPSNLIKNEFFIDNSYNGFRVDGFGNPQGIQNYFTDVNGDLYDNIINIPLDVSLFVLESDSDDSNYERLIIGENNQVAVAGICEII
jgi:hypothetical protein